jgi:hypothetical protein
MTVICDQMIESLRDEVLEGGELLSLLNEKETAILEGKPNAVLAIQEAITLQLTTIEYCRRRRDERVKNLMTTVGQKWGNTLRGLISSCAEMVQPLLNALTDEVNRLTLKTRRREQQMQMLLARHGY